MGLSVFVTFVGGWGDSGPERAVASAQRAIAVENVGKAVRGGGFDRHVLVTDEEGLLDIKMPGVEVEKSVAPFHFGRCLRDVLGRYGASNACCLGGGSLALAPESVFRDVAKRLSEGSNIVISNNLYSGDLTAFSPVEALDRIALPEIDNPLPRLLRDEAGLESVVLERNLGTLMDVDTPTDLAILWLYPGLAESLRATLIVSELQISKLRKAIACFTNKEARITVAGRVGNFVWSKLETDTACRCRVVSEGRGMRAARYGETGKSILGYMLESYDIEGFFNRLSEMGDAAFLDTRVIFNHMGETFSTADRFHSDLLEAESIEDRWLGEFTNGAREAKIPVVLGGHSLVSGGMLALIDAAWGEFEGKPD